MNKKQACVRTTMWRMRIKLDAVTEKTSTESHNESQSKDLDMDSSFNSRSTEFRATQKVKSILHSSPRRKARVIEKVLTPQTSSVLKHIEVTDRRSRNSYMEKCCKIS